jgi:hypothetical protein
VTPGLEAPRRGSGQAGRQQRGSYDGRGLAGQPQDCFPVERVVRSLARHSLFIAVPPLREDSQTSESDRDRSRVRPRRPCPSPLVLEWTRDPAGMFARVRGFFGARA